MGERVKVGITMKIAKVIAKLVLRHLIFLLRLMFHEVCRVYVKFSLTRSDVEGYHNGVPQCGGNHNGTSTPSPPVMSSPATTHDTTTNNNTNSTTTTTTAPGTAAPSVRDIARQVAKVMRATRKKTRQSKRAGSPTTKQGYAR